jgi:hypothetical protein
VDGDHNSPRPRFLFDSAAIFLQTYLQISPEWALSEADPFNGGYPPWVSRGVFAMRPNLLEYQGGEEDEDEGGPFDPHSLHNLNDGSHLGMTTERQMETQQALFSMLGGTRPHGPPSAAAEAPQDPSPWSCEVVSGALATLCHECFPMKMYYFLCFMTAQCTLLNGGSSRSCTACGTARS